MRRPTRWSVDDGAQVSETLADIALNMLGLILIVLLVFILMFQQTTAQLASAATSQSVTAGVPDSADTVLRQKAEIERLIRRTEELESALATRDENTDTSGLWQFDIHVNQFVDHQKRSTPADLRLTYFVYLKIEGDQVSGNLFGVQETLSNDRTSSASHADVAGSYDDGVMDIEMSFTGYAKGASERLRVTKHGERFEGNLLSGTTIPGSVNYAGKTIGTRLNSSVFEENR